MDGSTEPFADETVDPPVRGLLHRANQSDGLVLTHGAGSDATSPLLGGIAEALVERGVTVLRCDLPFRQMRRRGPPSPRDGERDRDGLRRAVEAVRAIVRGRVFLGGHSYGARQATILAAGDPALVDALLLLAYPLHPPGRATAPRTGHFPGLSRPALFVHGTADPFGSVEELRAALMHVRAPVRMLAIPGAGHGLRERSGSPAQRIASTFLSLVEGRAERGD